MAKTDIRSLTDSSNTEIATSIEIIFLDDTSDTTPKKTLGQEVYKNVTEALIPRWEQDKHPVTITKYFSSVDCHRWMVTKVEHLDNPCRIDVYLKPRNNCKDETYLRQTIKNLSKARKQSIQLQFGTFVEVDFGYIPKVKNLSRISTNERYPDTSQQGEMHKRRLALVVKHAGNRVQVVPISSQEPKQTRDKSIFQLDSNELTSLINYNCQEKDSYVLAGMIETISTSRILPPVVRSVRSKPYRNEKYPERLTKDSLHSLRVALSHTVGFSDYFDNKKKMSTYYEGHKRLEDVENKLRSELAEKISELSRLKEVENKYKALHCIATDWRREISNDTEQEAENYIDREIAEYSLILQE